MAPYFRHTNGLIHNKFSHVSHLDRFMYYEKQTGLIALCLYSEYGERQKKITNAG